MREGRTRTDASSQATPDRSGPWQEVRATSGGFYSGPSQNLADVFRRPLGPSAENGLEEGKSGSRETSRANAVVEMSGGDDWP